MYHWALWSDFVTKSTRGFKRLCCAICWKGPHFPITSALPQAQQTSSLRSIKLCVCVRFIYYLFQSFLHSLARNNDGGNNKKKKRLFLAIIYEKWTASVHKNSQCTLFYWFWNTARWNRIDAAETKQNGSGNSRYVRLGHCLCLLTKKKKRASSSYDFEAKQLTLCSGRSGSALHWAFQ